MRRDAMIDRRASWQDPAGRAALLLACGLSVALAACGGDEETSGPSEEFEPPPAEPLALDPTIRGLELTVNRSSLATSSKLAEMTADAENLVIQAQIWSELAEVMFGRGPEAEYDERVESVFDEDRYQDAVDGAQRIWFVADLQRLDREWLVDWTGGVRDEPENREENMHFGRDDYKAEARSRIVSAAGNFRPHAVIIGTEMERHFAALPGDWPNFVAFVHETARQIRETSPETLVGVGINWSNFMEEIVPTFSEDGSRSATAVRAAWEAVIDPLYFSDPAALPGERTFALQVYGFAAIPRPERYQNSATLIPDDHYAGISTMLADGRSLPVAWFNIGWPANSAGSQEFANHLQRFLALNGPTEAYTTSLVSWWGFTHLLSADCDAYTSDQIQAPDNICFRGLLTVSGAPVGELTPTFFGDE